MRRCFQSTISQQLLVKKTIPLTVCSNQGYTGQEKFSLTIACRPCPCSTLRVEELTHLPLSAAGHR